MCCVAGSDLHCCWPIQASILTFLAQDADSQVFCYSNADIRKGEEADEIFRFIDFWKRQHGKAARTLAKRLVLGQCRSVEIQAS